MPPSACTGREETDAVRAQAPLQVHSSQAPPYATHGVGDFYESASRPLVRYGYTYFVGEDQRGARTAERPKRPHPAGTAARACQQLQVTYESPAIAAVALLPALRAVAGLRVDTGRDILQRSSRGQQRGPPFLLGSRHEGCGPSLCLVNVVCRSVLGDTQVSFLRRSPVLQPPDEAGNQDADRHWPEDQDEQAIYAFDWHQLVSRRTAGSP